ncbi:MAG: hypothetical protein COB53_04480 [Elusimicrobia bacterium]|nr:MAG: hypothetical protein COB53_04480 [Elusimicrobiota bacterium]
MIRTVLVFSLFLSATPAAPVQAASKVPGKVTAKAKVSAKVKAIRKWFSHWAIGLKRTAVNARRRKVRITAVAAVRGSKQDSNPNLPYWKGTWSDKKTAERVVERAELEAVVELALAGDFDGAAAGLTKFEKSRPKSTLLSAVSEAKVQLALLREATGPHAEPPAKTPEAKEPEAGEPKAEEDEAKGPAPDKPQPEKTKKAPESDNNAESLQAN